MHIIAHRMVVSLRIIQRVFFHLALMAHSVYLLMFSYSTMRLRYGLRFKENTFFFSRQ